MSNLIELYNQDINKKKIIYDEKQTLILTELNNFSEILKKKEIKEDNIFFSDIFNFFKKNNFLGFYIWGDVGRGKTYLIDLFFSSLKIKKKIRLHYHHFMQLIHIKLHENKGAVNPLKIISEWFKKNYIIVCLDEFFVKDIADAMQLANLFFYFFQMEIYFIITSNVIPNKLYEGGLQRQKFLPTIDLIKKYLKIININGQIDYRYRNYEKTDVFLNTLSKKSFKTIKNLFLKLTFNNFTRKQNITILNRKIKTIYLSNNVVWFDFKVICGDGRSQLDYIELASLFDTILISGITIMKEKDNDIARRFIALIDEMYDRKINIIITSENDIKNLYQGVILHFDFKRTISRLTEMSTKNYLKDFDKNVF